MKLYELDTLIKAVCPIDGLDSTGNIRFSTSATAPQIAAGQAVFDANWPIDGVSVREADGAAAKDAAKADAATQYLRDHTPAETVQYVRGQVNADGVINLATAQAAIKSLETLMAKLAVIVGVVVKQNFRD